MYGNHGFRDQNRFSPVKVGEELDVEIEASGEKGDGICKKKGFVLFVPNTKEGDKVKIRVTKVLRKVGFAEVIGDADESKIDRSEAPAPKQPNVEPEPEPQVEDSEDFGEEATEEPVEETPEEPEEPEEETQEEPEEPEEEPEEEPQEESEEDTSEKKKV